MATDSILSQLPMFEPIVPLTLGKYAFIDIEDMDLLNHKWSTNPRPNGNAYAFRSIYPGGKVQKEIMHRVILERIIGRPLMPGELVDHIDGDGLNNRRANLRLATPKENMRNRKRAVTNKSGYKGVTFFPRTGKWKASIGVDGKCISLGYFDTPQSAYAAYCKAGRELHGEFFNPGDTPQNGDNS